MQNPNQLTQAQRTMLLELACTPPAEFRRYPLSAWNTAFSLENRGLATCYHASGTREFLARLPAQHERRRPRHQAL